MNFFRLVTVAILRKCIILLAVAFAYMAIQVSTDVTPAERPLPIGSPAYVMAQCIPANGHPIDAVVIQRVGKGAVITANPKVIDRAVGDVFFGKEFKNVRVLGFCRL